MTAAYQDILNAIAQMIGGTAVDPVNNPGFYSGAIVGDSTGISGLKGCYSYPVGTLQDTPMGVVLPGPFKQALGEGGPEEIEDHPRLLILVAPNDPQTQQPAMAGYRDSVPAVFRAKMELGLPHGDVLYGFPVAGKPGLFDWAGVQYHGWEFDIYIPREPVFSYTA